MLLFVLTPVPVKCEALNVTTGKRPETTLLLRPLESQSAFPPLTLVLHARRKRYVI